MFVLSESGLTALEPSTSHSAPPSLSASVLQVSVFSLDLEGLDLLELIVYELSKLCVVLTGVTLSETGDV